MFFEADRECNITQCVIDKVDMADVNKDKMSSSLDVLMLKNKERLNCMEVCMI